MVRNALRSNGEKSFQESVSALAEHRMCDMIAYGWGLDGSTRYLGLAVLWMFFDGHLRLPLYRQAIDDCLSKFGGISKCMHRRMWDVLVALRLR
jgi:hypothetical protein